MVSFLLYDVEKSSANAGMPEKISPESAFLPVLNCLSLASAFRHQGQPGTAGHGLVRHCPSNLKQLFIIFPLTWLIPSTVRPKKVE
jgi:hypothetical protein